MPRFLDADVLLRYLVRPLTSEDRIRAEQARDLLLRVERGEERVITSAVVVFETVLTLNDVYGTPRQQIRDVLNELLALRGVRLRGKRACMDALELFASSELSYPVAYKVVAMVNEGASEIYSWDARFDQVVGVTRVEP
jgi:predicted nucleic acid-binding protein